MLWGAFGALAGGLAGNALFKGGQALGRTAAGQAVKSAGRRASGAVGDAIRGAVRGGPAKQSAKFFNTVETFSDTFTRKGAAQVAKAAPSFSNYFKPVKRTFTQEGLEGAAKRANNRGVAKSVNNLYLGFRMKGGYQAALGAVLIAGAAGSQVRQEVGDLAQDKRALVNTEYTGDLGRTQADMIGGVNQGRRDLGATGDIVLALNKRR